MSDKDPNLATIPLNYLRALHAVVFHADAIVSIDPSKLGTPQGTTAFEALEAALQLLSEFE